MVVGILNSFAPLARPTTLFFRVWRSIDWTPNAICGWGSMKMICEFNGGRTSSFGLVTGDLQVEALKICATVAKFGFEGAARNSPGWGYTPCRPQSGDKSLSRDCATCGLSRSWRNANAAD